MSDRPPTLRDVEEHIYDCSSSFGTAHSRRDVLLYMAHKCNFATWETTLSHQRIAETLNFNRITVGRAIEWLVEQKMVTRSKSARATSKVSVYSLNIPLLTELAAPGRTKRAKNRELFLDRQAATRQAHREKTKLAEEEATAKVAKAQGGYTREGYMDHHLEWLQYKVDAEALRTVQMYVRDNFNQRCSDDEGDRFYRDAIAKLVPSILPRFLDYLDEI